MTVDSYRQEILQLSAQIFDLAKWKLIAVSSVALVGLGWGAIQPGASSRFLLLCSAGFLCAYLDSLYYRRAMSIHVLAAFIRRRAGTEPGWGSAGAYEDYVNVLRQDGGMYVSDRWPQFLASLVFTAGLPLLGLALVSPANAWGLLIAGLALVLNIGLFVRYGRDRARVTTVVDPEAPVA